MTDAMIKQIAELQVCINDTYLVLRRAELFDLETIAIDLGIDKKDIDECIDDYDNAVKRLTHLITDHCPMFDVWEYEEQGQV